MVNGELKSQTAHPLRLVKRATTSHAHNIMRFGRAGHNMMHFGKRGGEESGSTGFDDGAAADETGVDDQQAAAAAAASMVDSPLDFVTEPSYYAAASGSNGGFGLSQRSPLMASRYFVPHALFANLYSHPRGFLKKADGRDNVFMHFGK